MSTVYVKNIDFNNQLKSEKDWRNEQEMNV